MSPGILNVLLDIGTVEHAPAKSKQSRAKGIGKRCQSICGVASSSKIEHVVVACSLSRGDGVSWSGCFGRQGCDGWHLRSVADVLPIREGAVDSVR